MEKGGIHSDGLDKKINDDVQGLTADRWQRQTVYDKKEEENSGLGFFV